MKNVELRNYNGSEIVDRVEIPTDGGKLPRVVVLGLRIFVRDSAGGPLYLEANYAEGIPIVEDVSQQRVA